MPFVSKFKNILYSYNIIINILLYFFSVSNNADTVDALNSKEVEKSDEINQNDNSSNDSDDNNVESNEFIEFGKT